VPAGKEQHVTCDAAYSVGPHGTPARRFVVAIRLPDKRRETDPSLGVVAEFASRSALHTSHGPIPPGRDRFLRLPQIRRVRRFEQLAAADWHGKDFGKGKTLQPLSEPHGIALAIRGQRQIGEAGVLAGMSL
jgi:hypothetical protein